MFLLFFWEFYMISFDYILSPPQVLPYICNYPTSCSFKKKKKWKKKPMETSLYWLTTPEHGACPGVGYTQSYSIGEHRSPPPRGYQLWLDPWWGWDFMPTSSLSCWDFVWPEFVQVWVCCHRPCEFLHTPALWCPEDTVFLKSYTSSGSCDLSASST